MYTANEVDSMVRNWKQGEYSKVEILWALSECCIGWPYVFGAAGEMCTPAKRSSYAGSRPDHAAAIRGACPVLSGKQPACDGCKWVDARIYDCRGFTRWLLLQVGIYIYGGTVTAQWETESNWVAKGTDINAMPHGLVCCVFRPSHTGMYVGNDTVRHCGGKKGQVVEEKLPGTPHWERWAIPAGLYTTDELRKAGINVQDDCNIPTLRRGSQGDEVADLQTILNARYGADLEVDGNFGKATEAAVKAFQKANGLTADGVVGTKTWKALGVSGNTNPPVDNGNNEIPPSEPETQPQTITIPLADWQEIKAAVMAAYHIIKKYEG